MINPTGVIQQAQGAMVYGLSAALYGKISFKDGRVEQGNFDTYQLLRINETPVIEVHIVPSSEPPGGMVVVAGCSHPGIETILEATRPFGDHVRVVERVDQDGPGGLALVFLERLQSGRALDPQRLDHPAAGAAGSLTAVRGAFVAVADDASVM